MAPRPSSRRPPRSLKLEYLRVGDDDLGGVLPDGRV